MGNVPKCQRHARALSVADLIRNTGGKPFIIGIGRRISPRIRSRFQSFLLKSWSFPSSALTVATNRRKEIEVSNAFCVLRACTFCRSVAVSSSCISHNRDANAFAIIRRRSPRVPILNIMSSLGICDLLTLIPMQLWNNLWRRLWLEVQQFASNETWRGNCDRPQISRYFLFTKNRYRETKAYHLDVQHCLQTAMRHSAEAKVFEQFPISNSKVTRDGIVIKHLTHFMLRNARMPSLKVLGLVTQGFYGRRLTNLNIRYTTFLRPSQIRRSKPEIRYL